MDDADMVTCENDHTFCLSHLQNVKLTEQEMERLGNILINYLGEEYQKNNPEEWNSIFKASDEDKSTEEILNLVLEIISEDTGENISYMVPDMFCPVCRFDIIDDYAFLQYLIKEKYDGSEQKLLSEIKDKFHSFSELKNILNNKTEH